MRGSLMSSGKILELFVSKVSTDSLRLDNDGVIGDKFYAKDINRSVLISSIESYELAKKSGITPPIGSLGENILMDYNPYHLPLGSQIKIGNTILEITQNCTLCKSLTKVNSKLPKILKDDRGVFAKVIKNGIITKGERVYIL
jgi:MOSC domain-containing protein YiiM